MATTATTRAPARSLAPSALAGAAGSAALVAGALTVEVLLAAALVDARFLPLLLLLAATAALAFVFRFPAMTALGVVALTDFIFDPQFFPSFAAGPINVRLHEVILGALLLVALVRPRRRTWGGVAGAALACFLAAVAVSSLVAVSDQRVTLGNAVAWGRPFAMLAIFWVVVRLFPEPREWRLLLAGAGVLAAIGGLVALMIAAGSPIGDHIQTESERLARSQNGVGNVDRVRLPALSLGYALFWYEAVRIMGSRGWRRAGWSLLLAGNALAIVLSFNRNMWTGLILGLILLAVLGGAVLRTRLALAITVGVAALLLVGVVGAGLGQSAGVAAVAERGQTILQPSTVSQSSSIRDRERETRAAWRTAQDNLLVGVGPGASFGIVLSVPVGNNSFLRVPQLYLHNQYLYLLVVGGVPALLAFLLFLGESVRRAWSRTQRDPAILACGIGIASIMVSAIVAIYFSVEDMTLPLGLLAGVIVAATARLEEA
jgi:O-antigen ligase